MQNKKSLQKRLMAIYVTFFIVLAVSIAHSLLPAFTKGFGQGSEMGKEIAAGWTSGNPKMFYLLQGVDLESPVQLQNDAVSAAGTQRIQATAHQLDLLITDEAPEASPVKLAFSLLGGTPWIYVLTMLNALFYPAIIVLMFIIIRSLRKSIRSEGPLDRRNIRHLRTIGVLTILAELCSDLSAWWMNHRAASVLAGSELQVDASFSISYSNIIMGILVLFAAEVFAVGQQLSEEQKLTI